MSGVQLGTQMAAEMAEQPAVLARLGERCDLISARVRSSFAERVPGVAFVSRGSSDHAALLGRYAVELYTGLPTCMIAPSVITVYRREPHRYSGWLVVACSQSGQTPEIVDVADRLTAVGAAVIAITNAAGSALSQTASMSIELDAGPEKAVPATKTATAQMLAMLAVARGLCPSDRPVADGPRISDLVATILADYAAAEDTAQRLESYDRLAVVGRGACYPAALEGALKLQETTGTMAHGFSTADFRHGPIAVCGPGSPAVLLAGSGPADEDTRGLVALLASRGASAVLAGVERDADLGWPALADLSECLLATVRCQQLALALARVRGIDPDYPSGLQKITLTH